MTSLRTIGAVAARELRSAFFQPLAWVVLTALLALNGWNFWLVLETFNMAGVPSAELLRFFFSGLVFWLPLLATIPLVAMRLIAEERQAGTLETLLTAPVATGEVVVGKFLGGLALLAVLWSPLLLYIAIVARHTEVDLRAAAAGLLGLALVAAYLLAAALCVSALTRHQIVAASFGFALILALFLTPFLAGLVVRGEAARAVVAHLDLLQTMDDFPRGLVDSRRLAYPLTGIAFFLFVATRLVDAARGR